MAGLSRELGIDLGTLNTRIAEGKNILIQEPTIVAILLDELKIGGNWEIGSENAWPGS